MGFLRSTAFLAALPLAFAQNGTNSSTPDPFPDNPGAQFGQTSPPKYPTPWGEGLGDWDSAYAQAREFVSQLTLLEKVNLTTGVGWEGEKCVGNTGSIPRLGRRSLCLQDSPLGVRFADFVSAFPAGVTVGATWDRELFHIRGYDMGVEHREKGIDVQLGPAIGPIGRHAAGGRNWEGFSPDPVLSGIGVYETVKGIQEAGVIACTKHYIANEQERFRQAGQGGNNVSESLSSNIDDATLHELYLWPFADAVRAGTGSIMCSYNQINNSYGCQNSYLQNYILKEELGFQGFIVSDWAAQHAGVASALAGLDMTMPGDASFNSATSYWGPNLTAAVLNGTVPQFRLDDMAIRIVAAWYYVDRETNQLEGGPNFSSWNSDTFGFYHNYAEELYTQINEHVDVRGEHARDIRKVAADGTVLLKNNGALPLTGKEKLTTVFGSDASENPWGPNGCVDRGCNNGTYAMGWGSGTAQFPYLVTPLEAIKAEVLSNGGSIESVIDNYAYSQQAALAHRVSQVGGACLVFANAAAGEGYITFDGNEGDRNNLTLWSGGDELIANVASECNNTIVVMHTVGAVLVEPWYEHENVTAIIWAGVPGQESGNAITDILYGKVNPGGKSPFTWGLTRDSYGPSDVLYEPNNGEEAPQDNFVEGIFIDYRYFDLVDETPVYEFGFGLSYTNFSYSNLQVTARDVAPYEPTTGETEPAPTYGTVSNRTADYLCPEGFDFVFGFIYPCLNSTDLETATNDPQYALNYTWPADAYDGSPQPRLPASSTTSLGGNAGLYEVLFSVLVDVTNDGEVEGDEVAQLYISLGGPDDAVRVLRNFDRQAVGVGATVTFSFDIQRRDLANWDTVAQDWVVSEYPKTVYVGSSSRKLPLSAELNLAGSPGGYGPPKQRYVRV